MSRPSSAGAVETIARLLAGTLGVLAVSGACGLANVGDQLCTEDSVASAKDDHCPYGPPGGPKVAGGDCPAVEPEGDPSKCTVSWANDVFPRLTDPAAGNCSAEGCHGSAPGARGIFLPAADPVRSYYELKGYFNDQQAPYVSDETPEKTWILCNLEGTPGGGSPMPPPSGLGPDDLALVRQWAACGMSVQDSGGSGGAGGGS